MMVRVFLTMAAVFATTPSVASAQVDPGLELGVDVFDYRYKERFDGAIVARDTGTFIGLSARYVETLGGGWSVSGRLEGANAKVDYRSDDGATIEDVSQGVGRVELLLARDFVFPGGGAITPSIGVGARLLTDESGGRTASEGGKGYDREISYAYVPVGVTFGVPTGDRTRVLATARYGWIVGGHVESRLSGVDPALPDLKLDLDGGRLFEASLDLHVPVRGRALSVGPFLRLWSVDRSRSRTIPVAGTQIEFFEPKTRSAEAGARVAFLF